MISRQTAVILRTRVYIASTCDTHHLCAVAYVTPGSKPATTSGQV